MRHRTTLLVDSPVDQVGEVLADLSTYPNWNDLVYAALPAEPDGDLPVWTTTLRARVGPLARSKKLRLVRTVNETEVDQDRPVRHQIRFERAELDGRDHAEWVMEASVHSAAPERPNGSHIELSFSYSGSLWVPALETVLSTAITRAATRLPEYVTRNPESPPL